MIYIFRDIEYIFQFTDEYLEIGFTYLEYKSVYRILMDRDFKYYVDIEEILGKFVDNFEDVIKNNADFRYIKLNKYNLYMDLKAYFTKEINKNRNIVIL